MSLVEARSISKHYGGVAALREASLAVEAGEIHALLGENGAGKSTLAKVIAGSLRADSGTVLIGGRPAALTSPLDAQRLGVAIIYQELDLFPSLTVAENLVVGNVRYETGSWVDFDALDRIARPLLAEAGLRCDPRRPLASLGIGEMQAVAIARALAMDARILLMDEPTSSLFEDGVEKLFTLMRELKRRGVAIVYVSHKMDEIFRICDRATVLRDGSTIGTRELAATSIEELIRMMAGREVTAHERGSPQAGGETLLAVSGLSTAKLRDISFELRRGEVLGIAGLVGSGRSELGAALAGLDRWTAGEVLRNGRPVRPRSPREAMEAGIGLVPEDRKLEGLMMRMSVLENATLAILDRLNRLGFVRRKAEESRALPLFERMGVKAASWDAEVSSASGGNQQKVLLAKCLLADPEVLFLDDPARGIDIGAKHDLHRLIAELAASGKGILLVSSELPELLRCSDRILVLREGRVSALFDARTATQEQIVAAAVVPPEEGAR